MHSQLKRHQPSARQARQVSVNDLESGESQAAVGVAIAGEANGLLVQENQLVGILEPTPLPSRLVSNLLLPLGGKNNAPPREKMSSASHESSLLSGQLQTEAEDLTRLISSPIIEAENDNEEGGEGFDDLARNTQDFMKVFDNNASEESNFGGDEDDDIMIFAPFDQEEDPSEDNLASLFEREQGLFQEQQQQQPPMKTIVSAPHGSFSSLYFQQQFMSSYGAKNQLVNQALLMQQQHQLRGMPYQVVTNPAHGAYQYNCNASKQHLPCAHESTSGIPTHDQMPPSYLVSQASSPGISTSAVPSFVPPLFPADASSFKQSVNFHVEHQINHLRQENWILQQQVLRLQSRLQQRGLHDPQQPSAFPMPSNDVAMPSLPYPVSANTATTTGSHVADLRCAELESRAPSSPPLAVGDLAGSIPPSAAASSKTTTLSDLSERLDKAQKRASGNESASVTPTAPSQADEASVTALSPGSNPRASNFQLQQLQQLKLRLEREHGGTKRRRQPFSSNSSGRPKRPLSAYQHFFQDERSKMTDPNMSLEMIGREISNKWKRVNKEKELVKYQLRAKQDKERYEQEMTAWTESRKRLKTLNAEEE